MVTIASSRLTELPTILRSWSFDPLVLVGLGLTLRWYLRAVGRLRASGAGWSSPRTRCFVAGVAVLGLALLSPIDAYAELLLSVHMVQHLLLTMAAPPLLLLGAPLNLAIRTVSPPTRARLLAVLHGRATRFLTHPILGWMLFVATIWASHLPAFYDATVRHATLHAAEHLAYVATAMLFWRPIVGSDPSPVRLSYPARLFALFLFMPQAAFLGLAIYSSDRPLYAPYIATSRLLGTTAVSDQHLAGAFMWEAGMFVMVPAMVAVLVDWMRSDEREAVRADARRDRMEAKRAG